MLNQLRPLSLSSLFSGSELFNNLVSGFKTPDLQFRKILFVSRKESYQKANFHKNGSFPLNYCSWLFKGEICSFLICIE